MTAELDQIPPSRRDPRTRNRAVGRFLPRSYERHSVCEHAVVPPVRADKCPRQPEPKLSRIERDSLVVVTTRATCTMDVASRSDRLRAETIQHRKGVSAEDQRLIAFLQRDLSGFMCNGITPAEKVLQR